MALTIRKVRRALDITQVELARRTGLTAITISNAERGKTKPSYKTLKAVSVALGVSVDELMEESAGKAAG